MPRTLRHLLVALVVLPAGFLGYHLALEAPGADGSARRLVEAVAGLARGGDYRFTDLAVLRRDLYYVEQRYVDPDRIDPDAMFDAAIDAVEREVPEVLLVRTGGGRQLHVEVAGTATVMLVGPLSDVDALFDALRRLAALLAPELPADVDPRAVEYAMLDGVLSTLDPHTVFLRPEAAHEMDVDNQGEFGGLGIEITVEDGILTVKQPIEGTPAARAGLRAGDRILRIEDESTINMELSDAVRLLRGEVGTPVRILVRHAHEADARWYTIVRDVIRIDPVEGRLLDGRVGYVRIKSFNDNASSQLEELLARLHREAGGALRGLVLDLRSNPGGYLNQAVEVADRFVDEGVIVATVEPARGVRETREASRAGTEPDYPMAVLVDANTASASEIVAGALRNLGRAVIVGERTFGKGSVQHLYENRDGSKLKLTVARYLTPGDHSIQSVGIPPDIELDPVWVRPPEGEERPLPEVGLYWREWVDREADLDHSLERDEDPEPRPAFALRYLVRADDDGEAPDPARDPEVTLARDLLLAAPAAHARRADVLRAAAPVVEARRDREERAIARALEAVGIDWGDGPQPDAPRLALDVRIGEDGVLDAGEEETVEIAVTNLGDAPVYRLSAVMRSDNPWLDRREFTFGRVDPGETRSFAHRVRLHDGYGEEVAELHVELRDPRGHRFLEEMRRVHSRARPLPRFAYSLRLVDGGEEGTRGDADGLPEPGERVALHVAVENVGAGPTAEAFAGLRNRAGHAVDLLEGRLRLGAGDCAEDAPDCTRVLAPGATQEGRFLLELREPPPPGEGGWPLELLVGDNRRYPYDAVHRAGFRDAFQLVERLVLRPAEPVDGARRVPPAVELSRVPPLVAAEGTAVLSGAAVDDRGVRYVVVYRNDEKVAYVRGGEGLRRLPFTVDVDLEPGENVLVVIAGDDEGLIGTATVHSLREEAGGEAAASR